VDIVGCDVLMGAHPGGDELDLLAGLVQTSLESVFTAPLPQALVERSDEPRHQRRDYGSDEAIYQNFGQLAPPP
jgi:hypothetical protein